jgi:hypothetical protein
MEQRVVTHDARRQMEKVGAEVHDTEPGRPDADPPRPRRMVLLAGNIVNAVSGG